MRTLGAAVAALLLAGAGAAYAAPTTMYSTNFTTSTNYAGVSVSTPGVGAISNVGGTFGGASGDIFYNDSFGNPAAASVWTLSNLPAHTSVTIGFDAIFVDSWDSLNGSPSPDNYDVLVDGNLLFSMTSANASGNVNSFNGGTSTYFGNFFYAGWSDRVVDMNGVPALTFAHSGNSLSFAIRASGSGWQGGGDESVGIDNLTIAAELRPVGPGGIPEPATWAMMIVGFAGVGAALRGRRKAFAAV